MYDKYEVIIGLEVHIELKTNSKIFCSCSTKFGALQNTQCCPICAGMPGTLPVLNKKVVEYAIKAGLATNCEISTFSKLDRKNYFYPDLPKAYQISQYDLPLCKNGFVEIECEAGSKKIGITRIHIEEDAGKLIHKEDGGTLCDYNRCGVPLIEIVSEPDLRSADEAIYFLKKLRAIMLYIDISDCKMQEGSMRCDVNLSIRKKGEKGLGTRTEMKNLNSFQFVKNAIEYEFKRQVEAVNRGEEIVQETLRFDENTKKTYSMRKKEDANDYRYFPEPDLIPIETNKNTIEEIKKSIPKLPDERKAFYIKEYSLLSKDAELIVNERHVSDYFETAALSCKSPKILANFILTEVFRLMDEESAIKINPENLSKIVNLLNDEKINNNTAKKLIQTVWENDEDPETIVKENNLWQISDESILIPIIDKVLSENRKSVDDFKSGKTKALGQIIGQIMKAANGQANPKIVDKLIENRLFLIK